MFRLARSIVRPLQQHYYQNASRSQAFYMQRFSYHSLFINPPVHEVPELTTQRITEIFAADIGQAKEYSAEGLKLTAERREALMKLLPAADEQLPPRTMKDSFVTAIVPLKSQPEIRERYVTADGRVRIGRLLEDMDVFAVFCCFRHILNPKSVGHKNPYSVVTALVDSIYITNDMMKNSEDVRLSGHVTYAGKSSMEVCIVVDQKDDQGVYQKSFDAVFLMVARDPMNRGSARINPLVAETPEEQAFLKMGVARQQIRRGEEEENIFKKSPNEEERKIIHDRFIEKMNQTLAGATPTNSKRMKDSVLKTVLICQPQVQ
ncbi:Acyl-coenzyme A thioesterase 9, mitochondrial [Orchesella cincta]|uniref:Acyl-coenzyme A thioesterase 9, mitochondrial n=1 Tax=Orchesella cincta TaxID=48709 RepID=A0A1D2NDG2_ORCCI|nr:Acyl-coenzyme A thioesterase 9, mitochondrial [Orchesella cincta]